MKLINMLWLLLKTHGKKGKTRWYAKTIFYFLRANPVSTASITITKKGLTLEMDKNSLHSFIQGRRKIYWSFEKAIEPVLFTIACTLEILSVKYEEYHYYHWNKCLSSFFPWQCFKKTSSNSKCNSLTCLHYFSYLRSLEAKYQTLVTRKIIRAVSKDKQLARTSILEAIMMLKKAWGELTEQTTRNCFRKSGISLET